MRRIVIDFDGVLAEGFPVVRRIKPGGAEALQRLRELGYQILVSSCRTGAWDSEIFGIRGTPEHTRLVDEMVGALDAAGIPYDGIDDGSKGKPHADFYIDDKALRFADNWPNILEFIEMVQQAGSSASAARVFSRAASDARWRARRWK